MANMNEKTPSMSNKQDRLELDEKALKRAKQSLESGAVVDKHSPWRKDIIKLLNDSLATEIVCILRYNGHGPGITGDSGGIPAARQRRASPCRQDRQAHRAARRRA